MRTLFLAITAGMTLFLVSAGATVAQDQTTTTDTGLGDLVGEEPSTDFFKLGETVTVEYNALDIDNAITALAEQVCGKDGLDNCGFNTTVNQAIIDANSERLVALIEAQTEITELRAATEVAKHRWIAAEAIRKANEAEIAAGIAVDADALAEVMAEITELADNLNRLSILVEGDDNSSDAGLDQEVASLADRIYTLEETINVTVENSNVLVSGMLAFCGNNPAVSWCQMLSGFELP